MNIYEKENKKIFVKNGNLVYESEGYFLVKITQKHPPEGSWNKVVNTKKIFVIIHPTAYNNLSIILFSAFLST